MSTVATYYGDLDITKHAIKQQVLEKFPTNPTETIAGRIIYNTINNLPYYYNGTEWVAIENFNGSIPNIQYSGNIIFVHSSFNGNYPYYPTIEDGISHSSVGDTIIVFAGTYTMSGFSTNKTHLVCMAGVQILSSGDIIISDSSSIAGEAEIYCSGYTVKIQGGFNYELRLEANLVSSNNLLVEGYGKIKCNSIQNIEITNSYLAPEQSAVSLDSDFVANLSINMDNTRLNANITKIGYIVQSYGNTTIEFKYSEGITGSSTHQIKLQNPTPKDSKFKLIDGRLSDDFNSTTYFPIYVSGNVIVELQHIWSKNGHGSCVYIDNTTRNAHLLKVDNCILIANTAIDSTLTGESVYCFGSWGQNDVSTNISMETEALNVGAIW